MIPLTDSNRKPVVVSYENWGLYNNPEVNERKAELPLAFWFIEHFPDRLFEVGEVSPFYREVSHTVFDPLPEKAGTLKLDANDIDFTGKNVLSISTVEHVGSGDYGLQAVPHAAIALVKKIVSQANNWLITFAVGSNLELEADLLSAGIKFFLIERSPDNTWAQVNYQDFGHYAYNTPLPHGNAIFIISNLNVNFEFVHSRS